MNITSFKDINNFILIKKEENGRDIRLYNFENVRLVGISNYYPDILFMTENYEKLILPLKEMSMSLHKKSYYEENGMFFDNIENYENYNIINQELYFFIYNTENYYHFIYDTLPYLYCYLEIRKSNKDLKLLMNYNKGKNVLLPFVKETLELLDIYEKDIIIHNPNNKYKKIYLSNSLTHDGLSNQKPREEIFKIYDILVKKALEKEVNIPKYKKIYISRRTNNKKCNINIGTDYTQRRKLLNENELVKNLENLGFKEFFGEELNMLQKIIFFYQAEIVIGAIGGTITNTIFCNKKCKIICLVSPDFLRINQRMKYILNNNTILFNDTYLDKNDNLVPLNVRIKVIDENNKYYNFLGEIDSYTNNKYLIKLANNYIGWNQEETYQTTELEEKQFITLDNGLNSPWFVKMDKLLYILY